MKRRSFLQLLGAAPAVAIAPTLIKGKVDKPYYTIPELKAKGFGLAQIKTEGQPYRYDYV